MSGQPEPDAIYEATTSFFSTRVSDAAGLRVPVRSGQRLRGDDPLVLAHPSMFRLAAEDVFRRQRAEELKLLSSGRARARQTGGPPGIGLTFEMILTTLIAWQGEWPPTEAALAEELGRSDRRVRQVLEAQETTFRDVVAAAAEHRL